MIEGTELARKLQLKPGQKLWLVNVPQAYSRALTAGGDIEAVKRGQPYDGAIVFCETPDEVVSAVPRVLAGLPPDGLLWFAYRKGEAAKKSGLSRDVGWASLADAGYRPVRSIAFDDDWTGLRFRPVALVKSASPLSS